MRQYAILLALLVLFGCVLPDAPANNTSANMSENVTTNITDNTSVIVPPVNNTPTEPLPPDYTTNLGDFVWVNYTLWINGTVIDTNNETLAKEVGLYNPARAYDPFAFSLEFNKGVIDGFVLGTFGMKVNETQMFDVTPDRGYGPYDPSKVVVVDRYYNMSNFETVPLSSMEAQGLTNLTIGTAFNTPIGDVFINDTNEENVTLFYLFMEGHSFRINGIPQKIVSTDTENWLATIEFLLDENQTYVLPDLQTGAPTNFKVIDKNDQNITLDSNHIYANETLTFEVTLLKVEPGQQSGQ
ncbi:FKBP-type peptidyl-prolyl cis-trans isomerase [Candidatus Micrarchaeota archaeon]|nr:FKBP-type peptidyl-prolyl cis-trans isomerase [Candidatus Micrarchaeota archaeon]MBU1682079.1 FKBP-type peptidyl-prolyl cis-trans isomerase [Candidatus Micrarchaeota archaeon]